jgi:flagellar biosynthesis regulator FlbT
VLDTHNYKTPGGSTFTVVEQGEILQQCLEIDELLAKIQEHINQTGTIIPMRTLGHWEEMRLDQREVVFADMRSARSLATQWPQEG